MKFLDSKYLVVEAAYLERSTDQINEFILSPSFRELPDAQRGPLQRVALGMNSLHENVKALRDALPALDLAETDQLREEGRTEVRENGPDRSEEPLPFTDDTPQYDRRSGGQRSAQPFGSNSLDPYGHPL